MGKRAANSTFYPSTMVFPGGAVDNVDFIMSEKFFVTNDFSSAIKICAVREVFEESGIMILNKSTKKKKLSLKECISWRNIVHEDPIQFLSFCSTYSTVPDLQRLQKWCTFI